MTGNHALLKQSISGRMCGKVSNVLSESRSKVISAHLSRVEGVAGFSTVHKNKWNIKMSGRAILCITISYASIETSQEKEEEKCQN